MFINIQGISKQHRIFKLINQNKKLIKVKLSNKILFISEKVKEIFLQVQFQST